MHQLRRTNNGVDRTGLDALHAADANIFVDDHNLWRLLVANCGIQRQRVLAEQISEVPYRRCSAWRALIDRHFVPGDCLRVWLATSISALAALSLRQQCIDACPDLYV
jgi:hypothetical protein